MTKQQLYIGVILLLLASNLLLAWRIWTGTGGRPSEPKEIIIQHLHLDSRQVQQYDSLIDQHRRAIRQQEARLMSLKADLYHTISDKQASHRRDSLVACIGQWSQQTEHIHLAHFEAVRRMLRPDQWPYFTTLVDELPGLFSPHRPEKRP